MKKKFDLLSGDCIYFFPDIPKNVDIPVRLEFGAQTLGRINVFFFFLEFVIFFLLQQNNEYVSFFYSFIYVQSVRLSVLDRSIIFTRIKNDFFITFFVSPACTFRAFSSRIVIRDDTENTDDLNSAAKWTIDRNIYEIELKKKKIIIILNRF